MDAILEPAIRGLVLGALYAVVAMGLTLIFGVMRVINVAHGEFVMLGGYAAYFLWSGLDVNPLVGLLIVLPAAMLLGMAVQATLIERVVAKPELSSLMLTFGLSIVVWSLAQVFFTANFRSISYQGHAVTILGVYLPANSAVIFSVSLLLAGGTFAFLKFTGLGRAISATSQNEALAQACGINCRGIRLLGFGMGTALAATGGVLVAIAFVIYPQIGLTYIGKAFAVAVIGGMGSIPGAVAGGLILGLIESFGAHHLTAQVAQLASYILIVLVLIIRPAGLFGTAD